MSKESIENEKIDIVIPWVDGNDKEWQKERNIYAGKDPEDVSEKRYRDMGLLKYLFRGIEKNMPWINKVYFITNGQKPSWLNEKCPKLVWIKHEDYIPKEYLPTFSSHPIELNIHRIKELSNKIIYFNDDTFVTDTINIDDFYKDDTPRYVAGLDIIKLNDRFFQNILFNNMCMIFEGQNKKKLIKNNFSKFYSIKYRFSTKFRTFILTPFNTFSSFQMYHMPVPMLKEDIIKMWKKHEDELKEVSSHKFRCKYDVNQYIFWWSRIMNGDFEPANEKKTMYYRLGDSSTEEICRSIKRQKFKLICINDEDEEVGIKFDEKIEKIREAFELILHNKSNFEI